MNNIKFNYLYRDGSNYKSWGEVVFANPDQLTCGEIEIRLIESFLPDKLFIASQIFILEKFLFTNGKFSKFDHCYHEFDSVEICKESPNDDLNRSITDFLKDVELASQYGWKAFNILDRFDVLTKQARKQAKVAGLKPAHVKSAVAKARSRK
jgi:hypothetical protein